jgi:hypothetical protein
MQKWFARKRRPGVLELGYSQMALAIDTVNELQKTITSKYEVALKNKDRVIVAMPSPAGAATKVEEEGTIKFADGK